MTEAETVDLLQEKGFTEISILREDDGSQLAGEARLNGRWYRYTFRLDSAEDEAKAYRAISANLGGC